MNRLQKLAMISSLLISGSSQADTYNYLPTSQLIRDELPREISLNTNDIEKAIKWNEQNGSKSIAVFSTNEFTDDDYFTTKKLSVHLYNNKNGRYELLRTIRDSVERCNVDLTLEFINSSIKVTDVDWDGISELSFIYDHTCVSDVSPKGRKLLVLEGSTKHILRGESLIELGDETHGGGYQMEGFLGQSKLRNFAIDKWNNFLIVE